MPAGAFTISKTLLALLFALALLLFLIVGAVLAFHWRRYGSKAKGVAVMEGLFFAVGAALILGALSSLAAF